jgi:hypothetical protein
MNTAITSYIKQRGVSRLSKAVEEVMTRRREECTLRLARIQNGKHPEYINGAGGKKG